MCISSDGEVFSCGAISNGVHGHEEESVFPFKKIPSLKNIKSISCSGEQTMCLDYNGNVFIFGSNHYGKLGIGKYANTLRFTHEPQKIDLPPIREVCCGSFFNICLSEDGEVFSFGRNSKGELGLGNNVDYNLPQKIESLKDVDFIECGIDFSFAKCNNAVYCWGNNTKGQLGNGNTTNINEPTKCNNWPDDVIDIKCGSAHTLVLTSTQEVYSCGDPLYGSLGRICEFVSESTELKKIDCLSEIIKIECGWSSSMCVDIHGSIFVFGDNHNGQLGLIHDEIERITVFSIKQTTPIKNPSLSNIIDISKGGKHTFVKTSNNEIYAFGSNEYAQLGIKTKDKNQTTPVQVFQGNEDIWSSNINCTSRIKSARK